MSREEFTNRYRYEVEPTNIQNNKNQQRDMQSQRKEVRYTAPRGTASRAKKNKKPLNVRLAALIMAAVVGVGVIKLVDVIRDNKTEPITVTQIQEDGINLGLSTDTVALFEQYDEYFEKFEPKATYNLTDNDVISMINDIKSLHFSVVKEKMGALIGEKPENITMRYNGRNSDGKREAKVIANEDSSNEEVYSNLDNFLLGIGNKNHIPDNLVDTIWQLQSLNNLETSLKKDNITKVNAIKELQELYENLEEIATGEFIKDEKGNISIIKYEPKENQQENNNEREMD